MSEASLRPSGWRSLVLFAAVAAACAPPKESVFEAPAGSRIIVAFGDAEGHVTAVEAGAGALSDLELRPERLAAVFAVSTSDFSTPAGAPVSEQDLAEAMIVPRRSLVRRGACSSCTRPRVGTGPQSVGPGDRCGLPVEPAKTYEGPGLSEVKLTESQLETLRTETELRWPGECEYAPTAPPTGSFALEACPLLPLGWPEPYLSSALAPDGAFLRVGEHAMFGSVPGKGYVTAKRDLPGPFEAVAPAPDGDAFVIVTADFGRTDTSGSRWERARILEDTIEVTPLITPVDILASTLTTIRGRIYVGGGIRSQLGGFVPGVGACDSGTCRRLPITTRDCGYGGRGSAVHEFVDSAMGVLALGQLGGVLVEDGDSFRCLADDFYEEPSASRLSWPDGSVPTKLIVDSAASIDGRVYVCGRVELGDPGEQLGILASMKPEDGAALTVTATRTHGCESVVRLEGKSALTVTFSGEVLEVDGAGDITRRAPFGTPGGDFSEVGHEMSSLMTSGAHVLVLGDQGHTVFRDSGEGSLEKLTEVDPQGRETHPVRLAPERLSIVRAGAPSLDVEVGDSCSRTVLTPRGVGLALAPEAELKGAAPSANGGILAFGALGKGHEAIAFVSWVDPSGEEHSASFPDFPPISGAAELLPGRFVTTHGSRLGLMEVGDTPSIVDVALSYDDPHTAGTERAPEGSESAFVLAEGMGGVVWVGGDRTLGRVEPDLAGGARATLFWFASYIAPEVTDLTALAPPRITALLVTAPNRVDAGIDLAASRSEFSPRADIFVLVPPGEHCAGDVVDEDDLVRVCRVRDPTLDFERSRAAGGVARGPSGLILVGDSGRAVAVETQRWFRIGHRATQVIDLGGDSFTVADGLGRLSVAVSRGP